MKKLVTLCFVVISSFVFGQNSGEIRGNVLDSLGDPVGMASVWVDLPNGQTQGVQADFDGNFVIKPLQPGKYNLHISFVGFAKKTIKGVIVDPNKTTWEKDIAMVSNMLKEFVVEDYKVDLIKPEDPTAMVLRDVDIQTNPNLRNMSKLVAGVSSAIKTTDDGQVYFRGSRNGSVDYYIDGVRVMGANKVNIPARSISSFTVYTGGLPAKYGDALGGVVVIETKSYFDVYQEHMNNLNK